MLGLTLAPQLSSRESGVSAGRVQMLECWNQECQRRCHGCFKGKPENSRSQSRSGGLGSASMDWFCGPFYKLLHTPTHVLYKLEVRRSGFVGWRERTWRCPAMWQVQDSTYYNIRWGESHSQAPCREPSSTSFPWGELLVSQTSFTDEESSLKHKTAGTGRPQVHSPASVFPPLGRDSSWESG